MKIVTPAAPRQHTHRTAIKTLDHGLPCQEHGTRLALPMRTTPAIRCARLAFLQNWLPMCLLRCRHAARCFCLGTQIFIPRQAFVSLYFAGDNVTICGALRGHAVGYRPFRPRRAGRSRLDAYLTASGLRTAGRGVGNRLRWIFDSGWRIPRRGFAPSVTVADIYTPAVDRRFHLRNAISQVPFASFAFFCNAVRPDSSYTITRRVRLLNIPYLANVFRSQLRDTCCRAYDHRSRRCLAHWTGHCRGRVWHTLQLQRLLWTPQRQTRVNDVTCGYPQTLPCHRPCCLHWPATRLQAITILLPYGRTHGMRLLSGVQARWFSSAKRRLYPGTRHSRHIHAARTYAIASS